MSPYRQSPYSRGYRFNWSGFITPGLKVLILANVAVFFVQTLVGMFLGDEATIWINHVFGLVPYAVTHGLRVWQPFTYMFLHAGLFHILINMFVLWMFGRDLELTWGRRRFYSYYFVCGVGAAVINIIVKTIPMLMGQPPSLVPTVGASGAIFGVLMANAVLFPDRKIWLIPFPITIAMRPYVAVMAAIEFFGTLGSGGDNVSHICHLGGMLVGYIYLRRGSFLYRVRNQFTDWKHRRMRRKFEVYMRNQRGDPPSRPDNWIN